ncbi:MAG: hypothetical protein QXS54_13330, partial [Candidatus Methanomethylicaceae archaeon]
IRDLKKRGDAGPFRVKIAPGHYQLAEPLVLEPQDSGTAEAPWAASVCMRLAPSVEPISLWSWWFYSSFPVVCMSAAAPK